jgi:hypothetical protein
MTGRTPAEARPADRPEPARAAGAEPTSARAPRGGSAAAPAYRGRASAFRHAEAKRRSARRERITDAVLAVAVLVGAYGIVTSPPNSLWTANGLAGSPGPAVRVNFGAVSVSTVSCGSGGTAYVERIPWTNSTRPVTTGDVYVEVYAIFDGDNLGLGDPAALVTPSSACAGSPPDSIALWYVVLEGPNGTNLATYTVANAWTGVSGGPADLPIGNSSALVLVSNSSLAGSGRGLKVLGFLDEGPISGAVVL